MTTYVERILVPDASRTRLLVVGREVPSLPAWSLEDPQPADSFRTARTDFGVSSPFLRVVRLEGDDMRDPEIFLLLEFDAPPASWQPPAGLAWLALTDVASVPLEAGPFGPDVSAWTAELASGVVPPGRAEWARSGWFESTAAWLTTEVEGLGRTTTGAVEQLSSWEIGSLLAVDTDRGRVVLKTVPQLFGHEPELTRALAKEHPELLPVVIAADPVRRHLLMEAFAGKSLFAEAPARWADALVAISTIHHAWIGRGRDAERVGVEDRTLAALARELESIATDERASPGLDPAAREQLMSNLPRYRDFIARLQAGPVPETLIHADFHPGNVQRDGDRLVLYDWSDACWGHPFFDVPTFTSRTDDLEAREAMRSAYLATWADHADETSLRRALAWSAPLAELHLAITWRRLQAIFLDAAFPFVASGVQRHLEFALAATTEAAGGS
jgi:hypothetical protein